MSRSRKLFLQDIQDIVEACEKILRYTEGMGLARFVADSMAYDAVLRNLEVIGEAAKMIPEEVRRAHPEVQWRAIAGLRDILAHAYFALDDPTLWDVVRNKVPVLLEQARRILEEEP